MTTSITASSEHVPGLEYLSGLPVVDGRLKVLWLEDKIEVDLSIELEPFIQVTRLLVPEAAEALLQAQRTVVIGARRAAAYELTECPHDLYIADHRLDEAPTNVVGDSTPARRAEAAGLTTAVMMALSFPAHPATVMPYTAHDEQIRNQRDLLKRLCPDFVNVCWGNEVGKLGRGLAQVLLDTIKAHRAFLADPTNRDLIYLRLTEAARVRAAIETSFRKREPWPGQQVITLETQWGSRSILLGALWPEAALRKDVLDASRQAEILSWLDSFPTPTDEELAARSLADRYFWLSMSDKSKARYRLAHMLRAGFGPDEGSETNDTVRETCAAIGLNPVTIQDYVAAKQLGAEPPKVSIPPEWRVPHLIDAAKKEGLQNAVVRLAVLSLLVQEEAARSAIRDELTDDLTEPARELLALWSRTYGWGHAETIGRLGRLVAAYVQRDRFDEDDESLGAIKLLFENAPSAVSNGGFQALLALLSFWDDSHRTDALTARDLPRLIDPLPQQLDTADDKVAGDRIGHALIRLGFPHPTALLSAGNSDQITAIERRAMQRFALDLAFPSDRWPSWMR